MGLLLIAILLLFGKIAPVIIAIVIILNALFVIINQKLIVKNKKENYAVSMEHRKSKTFLRESR